MATKQADGTSAVTTTSTRNNRGVIRHGGVIGSTRFIARPIREVQPLMMGNIVWNNADIDVALSSGIYNAQRAGKYVMKKVTTELAGLTKTTLRSGGADFGQRRPIHFIESIRTTFLHSWTWTSNSEGHPTYTGVKTTTLNNFGTDDAARPSRLVPGELVYKTGRPLPVQDDYKPKND